jgi:hypothetical protein
MERMRSKLSLPAAAEPTPHLYFVNGLIDFACIGGASLVAFAVIGAVFGSGSVRAEWLWTTAALLTWVCNYPHFAATSHRLYHRREHIAQFPFTALAVPPLVVAGVIGSFASPDVVAPFFVKLFLLWSGYHYSGQTVGVTLIYARRAGFVATGAARLALSGFVFGTYLTTIARAEAALGAQAFYGIQCPTLGLPQFVAVLAEYAMWTCGAAFVLLALGWCVRHRRPLPPVVLLPAASQFVWFIAGARDPNFAVFVPFFHSLQYLLIAWATHVKERVEQGEEPPSRSLVLGESVRWGVVIVPAGALLFWMLPHALASSTGTGFQFAAPVVLAGVQIHHFFVDGVIWKLKNPRAASPVHANVGEYLKAGGGRAQTAPASPAVAPAAARVEVRQTFPTPAQTA